MELKQAKTYYVSVQCTALVGKHTLQWLHLSKSSPSPPSVHGECGLQLQPLKGETWQKKKEKKATVVPLQITPIEPHPLPTKCA